MESIKNILSAPVGSTGALQNTPDTSNEALRRHKACLTCRFLKIKCDGGRICGLYQHHNKDDRCEYAYGMGKSRTRQLEDTLARLEARLQELENLNETPAVALSDPYDGLGVITGTMETTRRVLVSAWNDFIDFGRLDELLVKTGVPGVNLPKVREQKDSPPSPLPLSSPSQDDFDKLSITNVSGDAHHSTTNDNSTTTNSHNVHINITTDSHNNNSNSDCCNNQCANDIDQGKRRRRWSIMKFIHVPIAVPTFFPVMCLPQGFMQWVWDAFSQQWVQSWSAPIVQWFNNTTVPFPYHS
ncbi:hypothetical protein D9758_017030 [Tetrapyrgos nigripes]|uniref:Zn(2)-C6 fungal-type domain-containing protein n=1 Tax=Tetrapyrgos nigripes TaxID=182062 RepID=A0A8H5FN91_9AGAR|nr:hypothetical protein D9758_017030 [Tetrapyrgos nigripes]